MASLSEGMGIGDFALSMMGQKNPTHSSPRKSGGQLDIENVVVSQDQRNAILESSFGIKTETPKVDEAALLEERKRVLKEEFLEAAARIKELVAEMASLGMTSTGQLGVGVQKSLGMCKRCGCKDGSCKCNQKPERRKNR